MYFNLLSSKLERSFINGAKDNKKIIALPEAEFSGIIIKAAGVCQREGIADIVLIGSESKIKNTFLYANFNGMKFIDPKNYSGSEELVKKLHKKRKNKGVTLEKAEELIKDPIYFATMLLDEGIVDGVVGGAATSTANMLRPALQLIPLEKNIKTVSSSFIVISKKSRHMGDKGVMVVGDCALNINPTASQLKDIALETADTARELAGLEPRVAMLSYSTHGSGRGDSPSKVAKATQMLKDMKLDYEVEGELQADSALNPKTARVKVLQSQWQGNANVLVFPNLDSGNIAYKLMRQAGKVKTIGPIMQGFERPVNDLSRGSSLKEIVLVIALTVVQAGKYEKQIKLNMKKRAKQEKLELKKEQREERKRLRKEKIKNFSFKKKVEETSAEEANVEEKVEAVEEQVEVKPETKEEVKKAEVKKDVEQPKETKKEIKEVEIKNVNPLMDEKEDTNEDTSN